MATETYELRVSGYNNLEWNECVLNFQSTDVVANDTLENAENLCTSWDTAIKGLWLGCLPNTYALNRLAARRVVPKVSAVGHRQYDLGTQTGTLGADASTEQLCPCIFTIPPMGTKSGGKIFMPCVGQGEIQNNQYTAGYVTAINALMAAQITLFGVSGVHWRLVIHSRKVGSVVNVLAWQLSPLIGFQGKRRLPI